MLNFSFLKNGFVPIIENNGDDMPYTVDALVQTCLTFAKAGVMEVELADRKKGALKVFGELEKELTKHTQNDVKVPNIGPGTIFDKNTADEYLSSGADFIVSPINNNIVNDVCREKSFSYIPGVQTVNEAWLATDQGHEVVKVYPCESPLTVKAIRLVLPDLRLVASYSGSTNMLDSIEDWVGPKLADAVVLGGKLVNIGLIDNDYDRLVETVIGLQGRVDKI